MTRLSNNKKNKTQVTKRVEIKEKLSPEEKIFGKAPKVQEKSIVDYENHKTRYKVTNLAVNNKPIIVRGDVIESFIGAKNTEAREKLLTGSPKVVTYDIMGNSQYKIEVL